MAKISFEVEDPTFGIPDVERVADDEVRFANENAARKWFAIRRASQQQAKLREILERRRRELTETQTALDAAAADSNEALKLGIQVENLKKKIARLEAHLEAGDPVLGAALTDARECRVDEAVDKAFTARANYWAGVHTGSVTKGLPVAGDGEDATTVKGENGKPVWIKLEDRKKHPLLDKALDRLDAAEHQLLEWLLFLEFIRARAEKAREQLEELEARLNRARERYRALKEMAPYSLDGQIALERAENAVMDLEDAVETARKALEEAEESLEETIEDIRKKARKLTEALLDAYRQLRKMYRFALACDTEHTRSQGERIDGLLNDVLMAPGDEEENNDPEDEGDEAEQEEPEAPEADEDDEEQPDKITESENAIKQATELADEADELCGESTETTIRDADTAYFENLYTELLANYRERAKHAPHSVDPFLALLGEECKEVRRIVCGEGDDRHTFIIKMKWQFGDAPKPNKDKPKPPPGEDGDENVEPDTDVDGLFSFVSMEPEKGADGKSHTLCYTWSVKLKWVGDYTQVAANKTVLYHEFLHGQMQLEWLQSDAATAVFCAWKEGGFKGGSPANPEKNHDQIYPWQRAFRAAIEALEQAEIEKKFKEAWEAAND